MEITIKIQCDDDDEALTHLSVIRQTLKKKLKESHDSDNGDYLEFSDSNCYGDHEVKVTLSYESHSEREKIEFAQYHVHQALLYASQKAEIKSTHYNESTSEYDHYAAIDPDSILNAYPDLNIK